MAVLVEYNRPFGLENEQDVSFFFHSEKEDGNDSENYTSTVPTMDIWKKFELLLTPPRSPSRTACASPTHTDSSSVADTLQIVSEILDDDESPPQVHPDKNSLINSLNLKSKLIQDCMWNSLAYDSLELKALCADDLYDTPCSTPPPPVEYVSSDCVDPTTVFPYPMNDTQSFCSSHTSDSEEEIDVVTIEKPKRKLSVSSVSSEEPPVKRLKPVAVRAKSYTTHTKSKELKRQMSSGSDDEAEDCESKRATHNVLERKRRNDLKTSFHQLREEVPEIESNERSPKVVILKKARDYVEQLKSDEARLRKELEKENKKNKEFLNKLSALTQQRD